MCISCELHDKWPPLIEFIIWMLLQGMNIGNHYGVWAIIQTHVLDITPPTYKNQTKLVYNVSISLSTTPSQITTTPLPTGGINRLVTVLRKNIKHVTSEGSWLHNTTGGHFVNITSLVPDVPAIKRWGSLYDFRLLLLVFCGIGTLMFIIHIILLIPNIVQSFRVKDPLMLKETGNAYFRSVLKIHCTLLVLETIFFDIPAGCLTMELLSLIWEGPLDTASNLKVSKMILAFSMIGLAFIALYKGMMPLYLWLGNPFCFPCIPLRLLVVFPGGLIAMVMTFGPVMGVTKNRLLQFAPPVMQLEIGNMANTFFSIGMIFWGCFGIIGLMSLTCWYKFCRPGADNELCDVCCSN